MVFLTQNKKGFFTPQNVTKFNELLKNIDIMPIFM